MLSTRMISKTNASLLRLVALAFLLFGLAFGWGANTSRVQAQTTQPAETGAVGAIGLDGAGNGWAFAHPAPQTFATSFLLRIENGAWRVFADSSKASTLLPPGVQINKIVLTNKGDEGWAIGSVFGNSNSSPIMWRLQGGTWSVYKPNVASSATLLSITITPDGSDGWMTAYEEVAQRYRLLRLRGDKWELTSLPSNGGALDQVALSPDGKSGWAVGPRTNGQRLFAQHTAYRLNNGRWDAAPGDLYISSFIPTAMTADNLGGAWVITVLTYDYAHARAGVAARAGAPSRAAQPIQPDQVSFLWRLSTNARPKQVDLNLPVPQITPGGKPDPSNPSEFALQDVAVDGMGRGWAVASYGLGTREDPPNVEYLYQPIFYRLQGDGATLTTRQAIGYEGEQSLRPNALGLSRDGAHQWVGAFNGYGMGRLQEIREPWQHDKPAAAKPLPGAGRCFAEVPHCMRGVFATYWAQKGGLDLFGFPITPEVTETIGAKAYLVQYTQRARFEYHPENAAPNNVLFGLLGNTLSEPRAGEEPFKPKPPSVAPSDEWFEQTQHNVRPPFLDYWKKNGGLPVFGLPKSEAFEEKNAADGKTYLVQYFERNRLEYHPENRGTKFEMLLGLLGTEQFRKTYGYAP